jgi:transcriptional regulator with XRE-family HTH domain
MFASMIRIKRLRLEQKRGQRDIADAAGVTTRTLSTIENEAGGKIQARVRRGIAAALGVDESAIFSKGGYAR